MTRASTLSDVRLIPAPERGIWRLGKARGPFTYDRIREEDAGSPSGNRWSLVDCGVLYCASEHEGCFAEALAPFRVDPAMRAIIADDWANPSHMPPGRIPRDWTTRHTLFRLQPVKEARFLDVDDEDTLTVLSRELRDQLAKLNIDRITARHIEDSTDPSARRVTRQISAWAEHQSTGTGSEERHIHGIAYRSGLGRYQCWAVFEGVELSKEESSLVFPEADALRKVAQDYTLTML
ncbi:RES domain-containing protein [Streptomyces sp. NPDC089799]|uniref:RES domain-containing protein n=1 Tax=Streptomyces sp. NPDC089799 TaxID=3155066 RepID=UPI0034387F30